MRASKPFSGSARHDTNSLDIAGLKVNYLTVVRKTDQRIGPMVAWECRCVCGKTMLAGATVLRSGNIKSCGCMTKEILRSARTTHGYSKPENSGEFPTYKTWLSMRRRCEYKKHKSYADYGGRGIKVCDRWQLFENFLADMGRRPDGLTLGRVDNAKGYEPGNCRWETPKQQCRNRRGNTLITCNNSTRTLQEWSEISGIPHDTLSYRLNSGWTPERAISTPLRKQKNCRALSDSRFRMAA